jgi:hypothetical protein
MVPLLVPFDDAHSAWRLYFVQLEYDRMITRFILMIVPSERHRRTGRAGGTSGCARGRVGTIVNP